MAKDRLLLSLFALLGVLLMIGPGCEDPPASDPEVKAWQDWKCPVDHAGNGITIKERLDQIIGWASDPQTGHAPSKEKATECRNTHKGKNTRHCAKVYAAWVAAKHAKDQGDRDKRMLLWGLCKSELDHDEMGN